MSSNPEAETTDRRTKPAPRLARPNTVCALFENQAACSPDAVAVICEGRSLTFAEVEVRVHKLACYLQRRYRIQAESRVALLLGRSERMLISILAVLRAGGAYVPIEPDFPPERIAFMLEDAAPALLLTEGAHLHLLDARGITPVCCWSVESPQQWDGQPAKSLPDMPSLDQLAYIMYTSGSTGRPKGVMVEHGNLGNFIEWCIDEYRYSRFDVVYAGTSYGFDLSNIELFFPLAIGKTLRLLQRSNFLALYLHRDNNVLLNTVPSLVQVLLKTDDSLKSVSVLNLGGEAVPRALLVALRRWPGLELRNMYGPTETVSTAINYRMDQSDNDQVLIGTPIANTYAYIVDNQMQKCATNEPGEILIGGRGVSRGYLNRPDLTQERFIKDPFLRSGRLYRTGDVGSYTPEGQIRYLGRSDGQVKIRGYRVELNEIRLRLESHPEVDAAVVEVRQGAVGQRLIAMVCVSSGQVTTTALAEFASAYLPSYMVPDEFVMIASFPLTASGKIDRQALRRFASHSRTDTLGGED